MTTPSQQISNPVSDQVYPDSNMIKTSSNSNLYEENAIPYLSDQTTENQMIEDPEKGFNSSAKPQTSNQSQNKTPRFNTSQLSRNSNLASQQAAKNVILVEQTQEYRSLATSTTASFKNNTPNLEDLLADYPNLQKMGQLFTAYINSLISDEYEVQITPKGISVIDKTVRFLISNAMSMVRNTNFLEQNLNQNADALDISSQIENLDPAELKSRLSEALYQIQELTEKDRDYQKQSTQLQTDMDDLYRQSFKLKEKHNQYKRISEDKLTEYQTKITLLMDKIQKVKDDLNLSKEENSNLNDQYEKMLNDFDEVSKENVKYKKELSAKKKLLISTQQDLKQQAHQIEELQIDKKRLMLELESAKNPTVRAININNLGDDLTETGNPGNQTTIYQDMEQVEQLSRQIRELSQSNNELKRICDEKEQQLSDLILEKRESEEDAEQQIQLIKEEMDSKLQAAKEEIEILNQQKSELEIENQRKQECISQGEDRINQNEELIKKIKKENEENAQNLQKDKEIIQKLRSHLVALGRFTEQLIENDSADPEILNSSSSIFDDNELRQSVKKKIIEFSNFAHSLLNKETDTIELYDRILGNLDEEKNNQLDALISDTIIKGESNLFTILIILVSLIDKASRYFDEEKEQLIGAYKALPFKREAYRPGDITDYIESLKEPFKDLRKLLKKEFGLIDPNATDSDLITSFMENYDKMKVDFSKVAETVRYKGGMGRMPDAIIREIGNLREYNENLKNASENALKSATDKYEEQIRNIRSELEVTSTKDKSTQNLHEIIQDKNEKISKLKDQLTEANDSRNEAEKKCQAAEAWKQEMLLNVDVIKSQRKRITNLLEQRQAAYKKRLAEIEERNEKKRKEELDREKKMHDIETEKLKEQIIKKKKKIQDLKKEIKKNSEISENLIDHQRKEMQALLEQNERITKKLNKLKAQTAQSENPSMNQSLNQSGIQTSNQTERGILSTSNVTTPISNQVTPIAHSNDNSPRYTLNASNNNLNNSLLNSPRSPYGGTKATTISTRSTSPSRIVASNAVNDFVQEVGKLLVPYCGERTRWTKPRLFMMITDIVQKVTGVKPVGASSTTRRGIDSKDEEGEWQKWAASIIASSKSNLTPAEMRLMIKDMITGSTSRLRLMEKLQSLRFQKKILLTRNLPKRQYPLVCNAKTLANIVNVSILLLKSTKKNNRQASASQRNGPTTNGGLRTTNPK